MFDVPTRRQKVCHQYKAFIRLDKYTVYTKMWRTEMI